MQQILEILLRTINWLLAHSFYRLKVEGRENVPAKGGALLVANHVAYSDPPLLLSTLRRPIRFLMFRQFYDIPVLNPIVRAFKTIPVSEKDGPKEILRSLMKAREHLEKGELVGIFAEGALTRLGTMLPFNKGFERIVEGLDVPIIPVHLDRLWGSMFSFRDGPALKKLPKKIPLPVHITFGKPLPSSTSAQEIRARIQEMSASAFESRESANDTLGNAFIKAARKNLFQTAIVESSGKSLNYLSVLAIGAALSKIFKRHFAAQERLAIMLPQGVAGALANVAAVFAGKVPVNLNYTVSKEGLELTLAQCKATKVLSSKLFLKKGKLPELAGMVYFEDLAEELGKAAKIFWLATALLIPSFLFRRLTSKSADLATIIFSSGSTGMPKGVMLSHRNILSNIEGLREVFQLRRDDCMIGVLPFFHSFGFTGTLWLPLLTGTRAAYHANPLDAGIIGELVQKQRGTLLLATPTFLNAYLRKCEKEQFATLRITVVGAEKLKESLAHAFNVKFNVTPLEGYGCSELSPVATLSLPSYRDHRMSQIGNKPGSVGHPLPGIALKIVDPDSFAELPVDSAGLLLVKGPNVMAGYLNDPGKTKEVIRDGWYITGDIAKLDRHGFLYITDRLSRFSKIGGEMVPHTKVEEEILRAIGESEQTLVVTAVPHEKKGEQLVVLHTTELCIEDINGKLGEAGLPNLWIPKKDAYFKIEKIPLLGTGKLDLRAIKTLAADMTKNS